MKVFEDIIPFPQKKICQVLEPRFRIQKSKTASGIASLDARRSREILGMDTPYLVRGFHHPQENIRAGSSRPLPKVQNILTIYFID